MAAMIELNEIQEKVILVGVSTSDQDDTQKSLDELEELAATAGAITVGRVVQNLDQIHPTTCFGKRRRLGLSVMTNSVPSNWETWKMRWIPRSWTVP